jgi:hypothetical protein
MRKELHVMRPPESSLCQDTRLRQGAVSAYCKLTALTVHVLGQQLQKRGN